MSVMGLRELGIFLGLLTWGGSLSKAQTNVHSQAPHADAVESWVAQHYDTVLKQVLPERLELVPFPDAIKWVAVVQIHDAFHKSEYWFSIKTNYDGRVEACVRVPRGGSLARQMRELREKMPDLDAESLSGMLRIDEYKITGKEIPQLKNLAQAFEAIKISPVMPDFLMMDPHGYHFWSQSQYGQEMSATLVGPGPDASKQPHSLVEWAERVRRATRSYIRRQAGGKPSEGR